VTVRRGRRGDARRLAEIHVETWRTTYRGVMPQELLDNLSVERREAQWLEWLPDPNYDTFVAESDGAVVGFVSVGPCRDTDGIGELLAIYVVPSAHGTGAGPALMEAALEALGERWDEAMLWVATQNPRARRFYERHGWVAAGERVDTSFPGAAVPETRYELSGLSRR
jgi:ribosomal protein S18 acetylase RimI-like enzyme